MKTNTGSGARRADPRTPSLDAVFLLLPRADASTPSVPRRARRRPSTPSPICTVGERHRPRESLPVLPLALGCPPSCGSTEANAMAVEHVHEHGLHLCTGPCSSASRALAHTPLCTLHLHRTRTSRVDRRRNKVVAGHHFPVTVV